jgi:hypothetical protein
MRPSLSLAAALLAAPLVNAAQSFAGSNLYYAAGLTDDQSTTLFQGLQGAGVKVLRVWLDGTSSYPREEEKEKTNKNKANLEKQRAPISTPSPLSNPATLETGTTQCSHATMT